MSRSYHTNQSIRCCIRMKMWFESVNSTKTDGSNWKKKLNLTGCRFRDLMVFFSLSQIIFAVYVACANSSFDQCPHIIRICVCFLWFGSWIIFFFFPSIFRFRKNCNTWRSRLYVCLCRKLYVYQVYHNRRHL